MAGYSGHIPSEQQPAEDVIARLTGERDRARDVAVKLEQELAALVEVIADQDADILELRADVARADVAAIEAGRLTDEETEVLRTARVLGAAEIDGFGRRAAEALHAMARAARAYTRSLEPVGDCAACRQGLHRLHIPVERPGGAHGPAVTCGCDCAEPPREGPQDRPGATNGAGTGGDDGRERTDGLSGSGGER